MEKFAHLIQAMPMWLSMFGGFLLLVSMAILIIKNKKLGKFKLLVEASACLGAVLSAPIVFLTLTG